MTALGRQPEHDRSQSALACGCDPGAKYLCARHRGDRRCVLGHWIRRTDCPACDVLVADTEALLAGQEEESS